MLQHLFPFLTWWDRVNRRSLMADFLAGLTGAVIVLPQGVAFAMIAGLPPEYGLYTAMVTSVVAALFGSSWHMVSGPATAISIVVFSAVSKHAVPGSSEFIQLAFVLTFLAGAYQFVLGVARMGTLVNFVSHTVIIGFTAGAAILIATSQVRHVLGIDLPPGESFLHTWVNVFQRLGMTQRNSLMVGLLTLLMAAIGKKWIPKWPYLLMALFMGSGLSVLLGGKAAGILYVQEIPGQLPPLSLPELSMANIRKLASDAFAIALLGLIEAVAIARAIATQTQQRIDGNQEFIGQGLSNLIGSFFSSYAGSGSFTRSGINYTAGAQTPLSTIFAAIFLALILLLVAPLTGYLPIAAMGGIILFVAYNLVDVDYIRQIFKAGPTEIAVLLVTFFATLFLELEFAIYFGVLLSLVFYLQRTSKPKVVVMAPNPDDPKRKFTNLARMELPECPQMQVIRIDGSLFFGAVSHVVNELDTLKDEEKPYTLLIAQGINFVDIAGAALLVQEAQKHRKLGGDLFIAGLKKYVVEYLAKSGFLEQLGEDHFFASKYEAIAKIYPQLNPRVCEGCEVRIFQECGVMQEPASPVRKE